MTGVHRGASQDVPLGFVIFLWTLVACGEQGFGALVPPHCCTAALLHRLHAASAGARCVVDRRSVSAVVRVMQCPLEIRNNSAAQAPADLVLSCSPGLASALQR